MIVLDFLKSELKKIDLQLMPKPDGREGVDFMVGDKQLYLQPLNLDASQRSIKISKLGLGALRNDLFVVLVLVLENQPRAFYLIPSTELAKSSNDIFTENSVDLMPSLSNWEIKVTVNTIPKLVEYSLTNMVGKLKE
ncbi:MAG: hypothetical protein ACSHW7_06520 [Patiriisocius sp.]|uniref:hypothetical protein n=1 Tax=Patiriisocius sp. TaxID=2822396 RepID=UPI003EF7A07A